MSENDFIFQYHNLSSLFSDKAVSISTAPVPEALVSDCSDCKLKYATASLLTQVAEAPVSKIKSPEHPLIRSLTSKWLVLESLNSTYLYPASLSASSQFFINNNFSQQI